MRKRRRFILIVTDRPYLRFSVYDRELKIEVCGSNNFAMAQELAREYSETFARSRLRRLWDRIRRREPRLPAPAPPPIVEPEWKQRLRRVQEICEQRKRERRLGAPVIAPADPIEKIERVYPVSQESDSYVH
jgi:hypothetical protein